MKVLKLKLFQENACYKKPFAFKLHETYPLPPYSTVKGMLHSILEAKEYIPMNVSIQGEYESIFNSYNTTYFYKANEVTTMPLNTHMLYNVKLIIHVKAEMDVLEKIINNIRFSKEYLSLGRREDLVNIEEIKLIEIEEIKLEFDDEDDDIQESEFNNGIYFRMPMYVPKNNKIKSKLSGVNYRLNWKYKVKNDIRQWEKLDVLYVDKGERITEGIVYLDKEKDLVFFKEDDI